MSTYRRRGHWRRGRDGRRHWVSTHAVTRARASSRPTAFPRGEFPRRVVTPILQPERFPAPVLWRRVPTGPNANCPVCGARFWFFRNRRGGCAYFDSIGVPWPKHPCMAGSRIDSAAARQAVAAYGRAHLITEMKSSGLTHLADLRADLAAGKAENAAIDTDERHPLSSAAYLARRRASRSSNGAQRELGWWVVVAMLLAWLLSLPFSFAYLNKPEDSMASVDHLVVTMPTVISLLGISWFLWRVPPTRPSLGRLAMAIGLAPIFLIVGMISFLLTAGFGSFVFALVLWHQAGVASTATEVQAT